MMALVYYANNSDNVEPELNLTWNWFPGPNQNPLLNIWLHPQKF